MNFFKKLIAIIDEEKRNMPDYQFKFNYYYVLPGLLYYLGGAIIAVILSVIFMIITKNAMLSIIFIIVWAIGAFVLLVLFQIYSRRILKRLVKDNYDNLTNRFHKVHYDEAKQKLYEKNIIVNDRLIICDSPLIDVIDVPLDKCIISFDCSLSMGKTNLSLLFYEQPDREYLMSLKLDEYLCSYFYQRLDLIENKELFKLFLNDKNKFSQLLYKYNNPFKMEKYLLKNKGKLFKKNNEKN